MKYLPIEKHKFTTSLPNVEVSRRLIDSIATQKKTAANKPFTGSIHGYKFTITRIIDYLNSFVPKISGKVTSDSFIVLIPFVMFIFAYGMMMLSFRSEAEKARQALEKILDIPQTIA